MNFPKFIGFMNFGIGIAITTKEHGWPVLLGFLLMIIGAAQICEEENG